MQSTHLLAEGDLQVLYIGRAGDNRAVGELAPDTNISVV